MLARQTALESPIAWKGLGLPAPGPIARLASQPLAEDPGALTKHLQLLLLPGQAQFHNFSLKIGAPNRNIANDGIFVRKVQPPPERA